MELFLPLSLVLLLLPATGARYSRRRRRRHRRCRRRRRSSSSSTNIAAVIALFSPSNPKSPLKVKFRRLLFSSDNIAAAPSLSLTN